MSSVPEMHLTGLSDVLPIPMPQESNVHGLAERLLSREQTSRIYQEQLEHRIRQNSLAYEELRQYCNRLENKASDSDQQKIHYETSIRHALEDKRSIAHELGLERAKTQELESRLASIYPMFQTILFRMNQPQPCKHDPNVLKEVEEQRQKISSLQAQLQAKEETTRALELALDNVFHSSQICRSTNSTFTMENVPEHCDNDQALDLLDDTMI